MERVPRNESPPQRKKEKAVVNFGLNPSVIILGRSFFPRVGEYQGRSYNSRNCHVNRSRDRGISMGSSAASCFFKFNRNNSSSCQTSYRAHGMFVIKLVTGTGGRGRTEGRIHGRMDVAEGDNTRKYLCRVNKGLLHNTYRRSHKAPTKRPPSLLRFG